MNFEIKEIVWKKRSVDPCSGALELRTISRIRHALPHVHTRPNAKVLRSPEVLQERAGGETEAPRRLQPAALRVRVRPRVLLRGLPFFFRF